VIVRRSLLAAALAAVALVVATARAEGPATLAPLASDIYRLRADARLCPSPMCGGFWASGVNKTLTTCLDGVSRPACYVGSIDLTALPVTAQSSLRSALSSGRVLLEGAFASKRTVGDELPRLAALVASNGWLAAGAGPEKGIVYKVADNGIRCIRAPCFSYRASVVNGTRSAALSRVALGLAKLPADALGRARAALAHGGLLASGAVKTEGVGKETSPGRWLAATQVWLAP
jgi:hypothetical protein